MLVLPLASEVNAAQRELFHGIYRSTLSHPLLSNQQHLPEISEHLFVSSAGAVL